MSKTNTRQRPLAKKPETMPLFIDTVRLLQMRQERTSLRNLAQAFSQAMNTPVSHETVRKILRQGAEAGAFTVVQGVKSAPIISIAEPN